MVKKTYSIIGVMALLVYLLVTPLASANSPDAGSESSLDTARPPGQTPNPAPDVMPSLREWSGGSGTLQLERNSRIVVDEPNQQQLLDDAAVFREDLKAVSGLDLPVATNQKPRHADIFVKLDSNIASDEGYRIEIGENVTIAGKTDTGVFYGMQTILQIIKQDPEHSSLPRGTANDYPDYRDRGFMIDSGHAFASLTYVENMIRQMAWHKMNTLHMHFTDVGGFRLQSDTYPGLASELSYSKADIRQMQDMAKKYHINLIPEIDLPAHAKPITKYNPKLKFTCSDMIDQNNDGWTLDITKPENREWAKNLLKEFVPLFDSPVFHLGADEYETDWKTALCPDIINYAKERGFGARADVFVDFINEMNGVIKSFGKQTMIWNWWDVEQVNTIHPDKDILIEVWRGDTKKYTDQGYKTVTSDESLLYLGPTDPPGWGSNSKRIYEEWNMPQNPLNLGFRISTWTGAYTGKEPNDSYFEWFSRRAREALAERTWGGPRSATTAAFENRVDRIGTAPGVPEYAPYGGSVLTGTPYGTSPAWGDSTATFDKAFDGDPATFFDYVQAAGGYTGIDLGAGGAQQLSKIRFLPRVDVPGRMTGGKFQGSNDGPDRGFVDLYTIRWTPDNGWNEVPVSDPAAYRWLRYVGGEDGHTNVGEIEFYSADSSGKVRSANSVVQADQWSKKHGGIRLEQGTSPDGTSIGHIGAGDWVKYDRLDFGAGNDNIFMATIAAAASEAGKTAEIRLDQPDGQRIGNLTIQGAGAGQVFREQYADISYVTGVHNVYLVFPSETSAQINWFVFGTNPDQETDDQRSRRTQWFANARFGQLITWGAYSQLAGTYDGRTLEHAAGELIMNWADIPKEAYKTAAADPFHPASFNAADWISNAKEAGQKYVVVTAKHHEGFSMFETGVNHFNQFQINSSRQDGEKNGQNGQDGNDPLAQLAKESRRQGLKFGVYYSITDWYHPSQTRNKDALGSTSMSAGEKETYVSEMKEQLRELIQHYDPDLLWLDGNRNDWWTADDGKQLYKYVRTLKSNLIVNDRVGSGSPADYDTSAGDVPVTGLSSPWESRATMNDTYGYVSYDQNWKSTGELIAKLAETASKGGNLLLNVGPTGAGLIPQESKDRLREIGAWLNTYGDSIYDTKPNIYAEKPSWGYTTTKTGEVYLHVLQWPEDGRLKVPMLMNKINRAYSMNESQTDLTYTLDRNEVIITVPAAAPNPYDSVIVVDVEGNPQKAAGFLLSGQPFGTDPAWDGVSTYHKVFDRDTSTFFDYINSAGGYAGIDLGEGNAAPVTRIRFYPRSEYEWRMNNGKFQGSNEGPDRGFVDLYTLPGNVTPLWNDIKVTDPTPYRWIRYVSPDWGYGNVAEVEFYTDTP